MSNRSMWFGAVALSGLLLAAPAWATSTCGKNDSNGCAMSPTTFKACAKDLKGDLKELACDIKELIKDVKKGNTGDIPSDRAEIRSDVQEIRFDVQVLSTLPPKKNK